MSTSVHPWRLFYVHVRSVRALSPSFRRVTFTGECLDAFADNGFDQRIKLILPLVGSGLRHLPTGPDWYARWRVLSDDRRNPVRTYTVRAVRPGRREVDLDMVVHGATGPATRWLLTAGPGTTAALLGPDAGYPGVHGGVEFSPPSDTRELLMAGDETAVPAVASVLERLPPNAVGHVLLEVPQPGDALELSRPPGVRVSWLPRNGAPHGSLLREAVPALPLRAPYAWLAGEAGVVTSLRRHLVRERGIDRQAVTFMGYWRLGRSEEGVVTPARP